MLEWKLKIICSSPLFGADTALRWTKEFKGTVSQELFSNWDCGGNRLGPIDVPEQLFKFLYSPFNLLQYFKDGVHRSKIDNILVSDPDSQKASVSDLVCFRVRDSCQLGSPVAWNTGWKCIISILTWKKINSRVLAQRQMKVSGYENPPAIFSWLLPDLKVWQTHMHGLFPDR